MAPGRLAGSLPARHLRNSRPANPSKPMTTRIFSHSLSLAPVCSCSLPSAANHCRQSSCKFARSTGGRRRMRGSTKNTQKWPPPIGASSCVVSWARALRVATSITMFGYAPSLAGRAEAFGAREHLLRARWPPPASCAAVALPALSPFPSLARSLVYCTRNKREGESARARAVDSERIAARASQSTAVPAARIWKCNTATTARLPSERASEHLFAHHLARALA